MGMEPCAPPVYTGSSGYTGPTFYLPFFGLFP